MYTAHNIDTGERLRFQSLPALVRRVAGKSGRWVPDTSPRYARPGNVAARVTRNGGEYVTTLSVPRAAISAPR